MVCRSTATQFTTGEGDMDMFSRGFARGSYTTMEPRWDNRGTASRVRLGFGSCPPPPFPPAPPFLHPPLIDGGTTCSAGGKGSNGDTQSRSLPHSHATRSPGRKALPLGRFPLRPGEVCSPPLHDCPLTTRREARECASTRSFLARKRERVRSHPHPRPRGGVPFFEEESYLSFHSLPRVARIARPIVSKSSLKHSRDIHSWERERAMSKASSSCASFLFRASFSVRASLRAGRKNSHSQRITRTRHDRALPPETVKTENFR